MGVKLLAWIGGLAAFLAVAFFVKYSFDNNLISREVRMALGFIAGLGLLVGGVVMSRKQYAVLAHTLCGTGVVILYAVTFACHSVYHFAFFGLIPTFLLMVLDHDHRLFPGRPPQRHGRRDPRHVGRLSYAVAAFHRGRTIPTASLATLPFWMPA